VASSWKFSRFMKTRLPCRVFSYDRALVIQDFPPIG
jgi:hypothetical protein